MDKIEEKIYNQYKKRITKIIKNRYMKKATQEAKDKKIYLTSGGDIRKKVSEIAKVIFKTYEPIIECEIESRLSEFVSSEKFSEAVKAEKTVKKLNYRSLKKYQEFKIGITNSFLDKMYEEVNAENDIIITKEEIKYILLITFYTIIEYMKNDFIVKFGTILKMYLTKRDIRVNLPFVRDRIMEDRLIPKIKLCKAFDYKLFHSINKDNEAIINYYKAKVERFLMLLKIKQGK